VEASVARAEELAARVLPARTPKRRMLVIVNPYATTVSDRLKNLVVYALQGRYEVEAVDTEEPGHATQICREAASEGYDVVVAFGGDGTVNEAANGLARSSTPLTCLPGGATNVLCRTLGIPSDVVDATEHLLRIADDFRPRRIDLGRAGDRWFTFGSGVGLDASVVERVDSHPRLKTSLGPYYFNRRYLVRPPRMRVEVKGQALEGVTVIVQNSDPFTYFGRRPIRICEGADGGNGTLSLAVLRRGSPVDVPTLLARVFAARASAVTGHRQVAGFSDVESFRVASLDGRSFPVQVDGDYLGEFDDLEYRVEPEGLAVVS
jgi:diacylglycerol kinase family enzyme